MNPRFAPEHMAETKAIRRSPRDAADAGQRSRRAQHIPAGQVVRTCAAIAARGTDGPF
jgi:hypothetical protein